MFQRSVTRSVPGTSNVVIAGATINSNGNYDIFVQKISGSGSVLWSAQYNGVGNGNDVATDVRVASNGEIYVCGTYYKDATDSSNAIVIKYSAAGTQRWTATYNGSGSRNDGYASLLVSGTTVVAVGSCWSTSNQYDMLTRRLDTAGAVVWTTTADQAGLADGAVSLSARSGSLFVAGGVQTSSTAYKIATWKINPSTGAITTTTLSSASSIAIDRVNDVQEDASGNVYVAGTVYNMSTGFDFKIFKYDASLNLIWSHTWDGAAHLDDGITGLAIDQYGKVIVTGYTGTSTGKDFATVKYSSAGVQQWVETFDGGGSDSATCIVVNQTDTNKIYVSGYSYNGSTNDYMTLRYDGAGNTKWNIGFNSISNANDVATAIALDTLNNIIVTGQNQPVSGSRTYTTVRYFEKNTLLPQDTVSISPTAYVFTKNNGQLFGTDTLQHPEVKYYTIHQKPQMFFLDTCVSYGFVKMDTANHANDSLMRVDMKFVGANSGLRVRAMNEQDEINNFYCPILDTAYEHVMDYSQLVSFNVWNGVDIVYGSNLVGLKYYFICKPVGGGGSSYQIDLKYEGADSVKIDGSGRLIIYSKLGNIVQPKAAAWELDGSGNFYGLGWQPSYQIVGTNEVKFTSLGVYNTAHTLVIAVDRGNPTIQSNSHLDWSTYYGGNYNDYLTKIDVNPNNGDFLVAGETYSSNFPVTNAITFAGGIDAVAARFTSGGVRIWSTYYGTSPSAVSVQHCQTGAIGPNGHYYIGGNTDYQSASIRFPSIQPTWAYADQSFNGGNSDAFVAEFESSAGALVWSTYYGGAGTSSEFIYDMEFDTSGNLYCVMSADSLTPTTTLAGAYNNTSNLGGMILKFDSNRYPSWATNFGTSVGSATCLAITGNMLYVAGTAGSGLVIQDPGFGSAYIDSTLSGTTDAYFAKFDNADSLIWCTYFGGTGGDSPTSMSATISDLYVGGLTTSNDSFPYYYPGGVAYIDSTYGGLTDAFLARFKDTGYQLWCTYYGGSDKEYNFVRVAQDQSGNPYFMGQTSSANFPYFMNPLAYRDSALGNVGYADEFFLGFNQQNQRRWATYFGGWHDEGSSRAMGLGIYQDSLIFFCGSTSTPDTYNPPFPTQNLTGSYFNPIYPAQFISGHVGRFSVDPSLLAGINETHYDNFNSGELIVYPNPSEGEFTIIVNSEAKDRKLEVYNSIGQLIQTITLSNTLPSQTISLNLSENATGVYFVVLHENGGVVSKKVIKQ